MLGNKGGGENARGTETGKRNTTRRWQAVPKMVGERNQCVPLGGLRAEDGRIPVRGKVANRHNTPKCRTFHFKARITVKEGTENGAADGRTQKKA